MWVDIRKTSSLGKIMGDMFFRVELCKTAGRILKVTSFEYLPFA
jgi:hypothetical protein